jgi:hypothetical protein
MAKNLTAWRKSVEKAKIEMGIPLKGPGSFIATTSNKNGGIGHKLWLRAHEIMGH